MASMKIPRSSFGVLIINNLIYAFGGFTDCKEVKSDKTKTKKEEEKTEEK